MFFSPLKWMTISAVNFSVLSEPHDLQRITNVAGGPNVQTAHESIKPLWPVLSIPLSTEPGIGPSGKSPNQPQTRGFFVGKIWERSFSV
jgi:hypothetical protein